MRNIYYTVYDSSQSHNRSLGNETFLSKKQQLGKSCIESLDSIPSIYQYLGRYILKIVECKQVNTHKHKYCTTCSIVAYIGKSNSAKMKTFIHIINTIMQELSNNFEVLGKPKAGHFFHMILPSRDDMAAFYSTSASFFRGHSATTYHIHGTMS